MGAMGNQILEPLSDADWSGESLMDERDPCALWNMKIGEGTVRYDDFSHSAFVQKLHPLGSGLF